MSQLIIQLFELIFHDFFFLVPSAPRDMEVLLVNASAVKVSWEKPLYTNGDIIGYYVYKDRLLNGEPINDKLQRAIIYDQHVSYNL